MNKYDVGDAVRLEASFTDMAGVPTDPTTVELRIRKGDGTVVEVTGASITKDSAGEYHYDLSLADAPSGIWVYVFEGTGTVQQAGKGVFVVVETVGSAPAP